MPQCHKNTREAEVDLPWVCLWARREVEQAMHVRAGEHHGILSSNHWHHRHSCDSATSAWCVQAHIDMGKSPLCLATVNYQSGIGTSWWGLLLCQKDAADMWESLKNPLLCVPLLFTDHTHSDWTINRISIWISILSSQAHKNSIMEEKRFIFLSTLKTTLVFVLGCY